MPSPGTSNSKSSPSVVSGALKKMGTGKRVRSFPSSLWPVLFLSSYVLFSAVSSAAQSTLDIAEPNLLEISPSIPVDKSPGLKPGVTVLCERVHISGLSRIKHLRKMANSVKVQVLSQGGSLRPTKFEVCFHRNLSLGVCKCPQSQWEKVGKGSWSRPMSPFDQKLLDIRIGLSSSGNKFEVSAKEEFYWYRVVLLLLGLVLMMSASSLSQSLVFYYSSAMAVGVILVVLVVLFQGMKLLPTGRKNSLGIFLYSSMIGLGSFLLRYLPGLLRAILVEMGISEDMYYPLAMFSLAFLVLAGAWLGFWVVRKLILTEDGSLDTSISNFVAWSIRVLAAVMLLQCSLDPILAAEVLILGIALSSFMGRVARLRFFHRLHRKLLTSSKDGKRRSTTESPSFQSPYKESTPSKFSPTATDSLHPGYGQSPSQQPATPNTFYSTFHATPERRQYSQEDWKNLTRDYTKKSLEELVSSPEFSNWAAANAERLTLAPPRDQNSRTGFYHRLSQWLPWR